MMRRRRGQVDPEPTQTLDERAAQLLDELQLGEYERALVDELSKSMTDKRAAEVAELLIKGRHDAA
jgi:ABC-type multidrug transport system ATPase subunit